MTVQKYVKQAENPLTAEFQSASAYGKVRLGSSHLFWRHGLNWNYVPLCEIESVYRRIEEVNSKTCCCSSDFSIHKLVIEDASGVEKEILIGDSLYRHEPELLLDAILSRNPSIRLKQINR